MNNKHFKNKKTLKIIGFSCLILGIILTLIGGIEFFINFGSMSGPKLFFLDFIGIPLIALGSTALGFGYRKEVTNYIKNESVPVAKDLYQDLKPEINDLTNTIKGKKDSEIICPKCGSTNNSNSKFCDQCGATLTRTCPICNSIIESDSKFCPHCGSKVE